MKEHNSRTLKMYWITRVWVHICIRNVDWIPSVRPSVRPTQYVSVSLSARSAWLEGAEHNDERRLRHSDCLVKSTALYLSLFLFISLSSSLSLHLSLFISLSSSLSLHLSLFISLSSSLFLSLLSLFGFRCLFPSPPSSYTSLTSYLCSFFLLSLSTHFTSLSFSLSLSLSLSLSCVCGLMRPDGAQRAEASRDFSRQERLREKSVNGWTSAAFATTTTTTSTTTFTTSTTTSPRPQTREVSKKVRVR